MIEVDRKEPSFTELVDYVMSLTEQVGGQGINLLQQINDEQKQQVLSLIAKSDDRLRAGLIHVIGLGLLDKIKNGIDNQYGNERRGAAALQLLDIYSSNTHQA